MNRLFCLFLLSTVFVLTAACSTPDPTPTPPDSVPLYTIEPLRFTLERSGESYELNSTCSGSGAFSEIVLNVKTANTENNSSYQVGDTAVGDACSADEIVFSNALFTTSELIPGESFDICVTVTADDAAVTDCYPVTVGEDGAIVLQ